MGSEPLWWVLSRQPQWSPGLAAHLATCSRAQETALGSLSLPCWHLGLLWFPEFLGTAGFEQEHWAVRSFWSGTLGRSWLLLGW